MHKKLQKHIAAALALFLAVYPAIAIAETTPGNVVYEGRLLDSAGSASTTAHTFRFSLWKSEDWVSADSATGAINTSATNYGGWYEEQTVTPNGDGRFAIQLGSGTAIPTTDFASHKYLQVEIKNSSDPDTSYQLMDPTDDSGADTKDRKFIGSVLYAKNAETIQNREIGTGSGELVILGSEGQLSGASLSIAGGNVTVSNDGTSVFNEPGHAVNFRIESDNEQNLFFLDGTNNRIGVATSSPETALDVVGVISGSTVHAEDLLTSSGSVRADGDIAINADNDATDAVLTFGNDLGAQTLRFSDSSNRFVLSSGLEVQGAITVSSLSVTGTIGAPTSIDFATGATAPGYREGRLYYNNTDKSLTYRNDEADFHVDVGQQQVVRVKNTIGSTVTNGQVVYINGEDGSGVPTITLGKADAASTAEAIGVAAHDIENGTYGYVTGFGIVHNLNTSSFNAGDRIYLSPTTAGAFTATRPSQPNITLELGHIVRSNLTEGSVFVHVTTRKFGEYTSGAVAFGGSDGFITEDASNLIWNDVTKRLGIGSIASETSLDVVGTISGSSLTISDLLNCDTIDTDANGNLTCGTDQDTASTASNEGAGGVGVYKQKTGLNFEFKNINTGSSRVTITDDTSNNEIDIDIVEANIDHKNLSGAGVYPHGQIDSHIDNTSNPHSVTGSQVGMDTAQWNANRLQGRSVNTTTPTDGQVLKWNASASKWEPGTDISTATGAITSSGNITLNSDNSADDAILTFGNDLGAQTLTYSDTNNRFEFSAHLFVGGNLTASGSITGSSLSGTSLTVSGLENCDTIDTDANGNLVCGTDTAVGTGLTITSGDARYVNTAGDTMTGALTVQAAISGSSLAVSNLQNCDTIDTDANGNLVCGTDGGDLTQSEADSRYVNEAGDTMTGGLAVHSSDGITASGTIITEGNLIINSDNAAQDAILTFGNDLGAETFRFSDSSNRFVLSGGLEVQGAITGASLSVTGTIGAPTSIDFATGATTPGYREGRLYYDGTNNALAYRIDESDITLKIGQGMVTRVKNALGSTVTKGQVVYFNGEDGGIPTIALGKADSASTAEAIGVAAHDIENGTYGYIITLGLLSDLDTASFSPGDDVFLSATTAGALTDTRPSQPNITIEMGHVVRSNLTQGSAFIQITAPSAGRYTAGAISFGGSDGFTKEDASNLIWNDVTKRLGIGSIAPETSLDVVGTISGSALAVAGGNVTVSNNGTSIFNDPGLAVNFRVESDNEQNMFFLDGADDRIGVATSSPETALDVVGIISGSTLHAEDLLTSSGSVRADGDFTINADNSASDAILTFGNDLGAETLRFSDTTNRFEFSDDLHITGDLMVTGAMSGRSLNITGTGSEPLIATDVATGRVGIGTASPETTLEVVGTVSGHLLPTSSAAPPFACSSSVAGMLWADTDTGIVYTCDTSNSRNKWLSLQDTIMPGMKGANCDSGNDIGNDKDCTVALQATELAAGMYLGYPITITGYGFSSQTDQCTSGSFDLEVWTSGSSSDENNYTLDSTVASGLTGEVANATGLNIDIAGNQYIKWGVDNNCGGGQKVDKWGMTLYYRLRHD